jgi:hypothetical protein
MFTMEILNLEVHATVRLSNRDICNVLEGNWSRCDKIPIKKFEQGDLYQHFNTRLQSLIPKLGPRTCINNYKPISVFTSTYKIVVKVLAYCFQPLILNCIRVRQTWLMKKNTF